MTAISSAALGLLRSRDQLVPFATVSLLQSAVAEALSLTFVLLIHRTAAEYVLGQLVAQGAAVVVALGVTRPLLLRGRDLGIVGDALSFAIPLVPASLAAFVLDVSDRLVVQHDLGSAAVARYAVARNIGAIPILMLSALNTVWMPRVFALGDARVRDSVLVHSRDALYALLIPVIIGLGISAPVLLRIWAPPSYRPDSLVGVVAIVATTSVAYAGGLSHIRTLLAAGRTLPVAVSTVVAAAINLSLNIAAVPLLGIYGSALATLVSYMALQALLGVVARGAARLRSPPPALVAGLIAAVAIVFLALGLPMSPAFLAVRVAGGAGCVVVFFAMTCALAGRPAWTRMRRMGEPLISRLVLASQ
jgi:O-antigen/teichoic acid export membrane protein